MPEFNPEASLFLQPEKKEIKKQSVEIKVVLATHKTAEDAEYIASQMDNSDIVFLEMSGWDKKHAKIFNKLSEGEITPEEALQILGFDKRHPYFDFIKRLAENLYSTNKFVSSLDVPEEISAQIKGVMVEFSKAKNKNEGNFESMLSDLQHAATKFNGLQEQREQYMLSRLPEELKKASEQKPELKEKEKLEAIIQIGAEHFGLVQKLKLADHSTSIKRQANPYFYGFIKELSLRNEHERPMNSEEMARAWLGFMLDSLELPTTDNQKYVKFNRLIVVNFSYEEIKKLWEKKKTDHKFKNNLIRELKDKGIRLPKSEAELDSLLSTHATTRK